MQNIVKKAIETSYRLEILDIETFLFDLMLHVIGKHLRSFVDGDIETRANILSRGSLTKALIILHICAA